MSNLPTPITDNALAQMACFGRHPAVECLTDLCKQMETDAMTLALRLYGEDDNTFSPPTREVMERWRPRVKALLGNPL